MPHDRVDEVERGEPEQHPRPGERRQDRAVEPERRPWAGGEVDEVGEDVRRVWQEQQPERRGWNEP